MLANHIRQQFDFNIWAWKRVYASVHLLDEAAYRARRPLFETTIHATLVHCLAAEFLWLERCHGRSPDTLFAPEMFSTLQAIEMRWLPVSEGWGRFLASLEDDDFARPVDYQNTRGVPYTLPLGDLCQHVINHATEHRSQLMPVLYFAGVPTEPLDYMRYCLSSVEG
jgi:uncharacterized damage-inducible protein DinB